MGTIVHDIGNHLAIAVPNLETFIDCTLEPTPQRLQAVLEALREVEGLVRTISAEPRDPA